MAALDEIEQEIREVATRAYQCPYCKTNNEPLTDVCISCKKKTYRTKMLSVLLKKQKEMKEGKPGIVTIIKRAFGL